MENTKTVQAPDKIALVGGFVLHQYRAGQDGILRAVHGLVRPSRDGDVLHARSAEVGGESQLPFTGRVEFTTLVEPLPGESTVGHLALEDVGAPLLTGGQQRLAELRLVAEVDAAHPRSHRLLEHQAVVVRQLGRCPVAADDVSHRQVRPHDTQSRFADLAAQQRFDGRVAHRVAHHPEQRLARQEVLGGDEALQRAALQAGAEPVDERLVVVHRRHVDEGRRQHLARAGVTHDAGAHIHLQLVDHSHLDAQELELAGDDPELRLVEALRVAEQKRHRVDAAAPALSGDVSSDTRELCGLGPEHLADASTDDGVAPAAGVRRIDLGQPDVALLVDEQVALAQDGEVARPVVGQLVGRALLEGVADASVRQHLATQIRLLAHGDDPADTTQHLVDGGGQLAELGELVATQFVYVRRELESVCALLIAVPNARLTDSFLQLRKHGVHGGSFRVGVRVHRCEGVVLLNRRLPADTAVNYRQTVIQ